MNTIATTKNLTETRLRELSSRGMPLSKVSRLRDRLKRPRPSSAESPTRLTATRRGERKRKQDRDVLGDHPLPLVPKFTNDPSVIPKTRSSTVRPALLRRLERVDCAARGRRHAGGRHGDIALDASDRKELLARFLRYVQVDTQSDENSTTSPSTEKQKDLSQRSWREELTALGCADAAMDEWGYVFATVPGQPAAGAPGRRQGARRSA